jgi:uncharacterized protein (DUF1330 family)
MAAYLFGEIEVETPAGLAPYRTAVNRYVYQIWRRFPVRGGTTKLKEGGLSQNTSLWSSSPTPPL